MTTHHDVCAYRRDREWWQDAVVYQVYPRSFADSTGDGIGDPMPIYIVEFTPEELWGVRAEPGANTLYAELFEAYLQPAEEIP